MRKVYGWLWKVTALRISMVIAVLFSMFHFTIENNTFEQGPLSKKGFIHQLDLKALDLKFHGRDTANLPEPQVVIAAIDETGIERFGLWPWRRSVLADFVTATTKGGAKVIAFDAVFSDEDRNASYVDIKNFLDSYGSQNLSPTSAGAQRLMQQIAALEDARAATTAAIKGVEKLIVAQRGDGKAQLLSQLAKARKANERSKKNIKEARASLSTYYQRASKFEAQMRHVVQSGSPDAALERAIAASPNTILGYFTFANPEEIVGLDKDELAAAAANIERIAITNIFEHSQIEIGGNTIEQIAPVDVDLAKLWVHRVVAMRAPLPRFGKVAKNFGYFNAIPDADGPTRTIRMFHKYENKLYPALSLVTAALFLETEILPLIGQLQPNTLEGVLLGDVEVPTNMQGHLQINYYKKGPDYFPTCSIVSFIESPPPIKCRLADEEIEIDYKDKVVLLGMTALGLEHDQRATPFSPAIPGVYIHAAAIQNMLDGRFLERYFGIALIEILAFLLLGLVMGVTMPRVPPWAGAMLTAGFAVGLYFFDTAFIFSRGTWMLNVLPTLQATATFIGVNLYGYLTEGKEKRKIRKAFQFYLTKSVVDEMLKEPGKLKLGGEKRNCTVLFSDIRGFTTISERLTPEQLSSLLNEYLTPMTNLVFKYDGTLDKYMGDAIMAIFGAPVAYEDHAARSCFCALEMMEELHVLQRGWHERGMPELDIGIGMNSGDMAVGNMGSEVRFDYTVMGDNVNLGSRLEGINKQYGTNITISAATRNAAGDRIYVREMDSVRVKGKREPVVIFEVLGKGPTPEKIKDLIETFEKGLTTYKAQQWDAAIELFSRVRKDLKPNDFASNMYIQRCDAMRENPPGEDWDGVFTMTTK